MNARVRDCAAIATVFAISTLPYVGRTGPFSDDWDFAAIAAHASTGGPIEIFVALEAQDRTLRPLQFAALAVAYAAGHGSTMVDALITTLLAGSVPVAFYLALRAVSVGRRDSVAAAFVAALAPNAATNRFWFAVPANVSLLLACASVLAGCAASARRGRGAWSFGGLAIGFEIATGLTYEVALPAFVVIAAAYARRSRALAFATIVTASALVLVKASIESRARYEPNGLALFVLRHAWSFARVQFVELGVALPWTARTACGLLSAPSIVVASIVGLGCAWYLSAGDVGSEPFERRRIARLFVAGASLGVTAYALFAVDHNTQWTASGVENRKLAAFALGFALLVVGVGNAVARALGARFARPSFACAVGLYAFAATSIVEVVGAADVAAARMARVEVARVAAAVESLPRGAVVLLGGCDDIGPGIVLEGPWDATAALRASRVGAGAGVRGDVVSTTTRVDADAVVTRVYGSVARYALGPRLIGVDTAARSATALVDRRRAMAFVNRTRRSPANAACAGGDAGLGAPVFPVDREIAQAGPLDVGRLRRALNGGDGDR